MFSPLIWGLRQFDEEIFRIRGLSQLEFQKGVSLLEGGPEMGFVLWQVVLLVPSLVCCLRSSVERSQKLQLKNEHCLTELNY